MAVFPVSRCLIGMIMHKRGRLGQDAGGHRAQFDQLYEIACNALASSMINEKPFEPPNTDRLVLTTSAYGLPLLYVDIFKPDYLLRPVLRFERRVFLRKQAHRIALTAPHLYATMNGR